VIPTPRDVLLHDEGGVPFAATSWEGARGSGVLIVHGLLGSRALPEIRRVAEALAADHDVLAIDVRGHGDSPGRFTWGREEWRQADAAARALAAPGRRVSAVGFSFGGFHALRAAASGAPIGRLVVVGAPCDLRVLDHFPLGARLWRHLPLVLRRRRRRFAAEIPPLGRGSRLAEDEIARITAPVLVVHGQWDWLISERHAARLARELPAASRLDVPRGLHGEYLVASHERALLDAVTDVLAREGRPGPDAASWGATIPRVP